MLTFLTSKIEYPTDDTKEVYPSPNPLCPSKATWSEGCDKQGLGWNLFIVEFIVSFAIVFSWLLVRNFEIQGEAKKWMAPIGSFLIMQVYVGCLPISVTTSAGPANPILALMQWFWTLGAYNNKIPSENNQTTFEYFHYGRYIWVYALAPLAASLLAGFLARKHEAVVAEHGTGEKKENVLF